MRFSLLTRAAEIFVDDFLKAGVNLEECLLTSLPAVDCPKYGFIAVMAIRNGKRIASITQDIYSAMCEDKIEEARQFLHKKINKLYDSRRYN